MDIDVMADTKSQLLLMGDEEGDSPCTKYRLICITRWLTTCGVTLYSHQCLKDTNSHRLKRCLAWWGELEDKESLGMHVTNY